MVGGGDGAVFKLLNQGIHSWMEKDYQWETICVQKHLMPRG